MSDQQYHPCGVDMAADPELASALLLAYQFARREGADEKGCVAAISVTCDLYRVVRDV